jgi:rhamnose utilization protein RhaD (predicted bifunctional aldolase and dehydrogenase)
MGASEYPSLVALSARIGRNLDLVQAGGGNTSLKEDRVLWVKASGKWLTRAESDDVFLPVPMADIEQSLETGEDLSRDYRTVSGALLRPSVETTLHGILPQRVVIHVHSVRTIAWASTADGQTGVARRLAGLKWSWIPYTHPGVPLAQRIQAELASKPDILILGNHGLVVAAENCYAAERLLETVEQRLNAETRDAGHIDKETLLRLIEGTSWRIPDDEEVHSLALSKRSCQIASAGTLFPDQCVYLGPGAAVLNPGDLINRATWRYKARYDFEPAFLLVQGHGVLTRADMNQAARELLLCLKRVIERIPDDAQVTYLSSQQVTNLLNWDAEKYRLKMR